MDKLDSIDTRFFCSLNDRHWSVNSFCTFSGHSVKTHIPFSNLNPCTRFSWIVVERYFRKLKNNQKMLFIVKQWLQAGSQLENEVVTYKPRKKISAIWSYFIAFMRLWPNLTEEFCPKRDSLLSMWIFCQIVLSTLRCRNSLAPSETPLRYCVLSSSRLRSMGDRQIRGLKKVFMTGLPQESMNTTYP